ncbi:hypothetical protein ANCDUO_19041 [Ancylostoma duodenale]|uniref:Uncharacterized protein n=1 Tax=Ancylostoma duodenale TaxID=51022 RepID=A0A0C2CME6_9BILA|nr:hypothetical protein ANCDUO_19041 [Ancylostoma duodenale]
MPGFWTTANCSPDLTPLDFAIGSILEQRACSFKHKSLDSLKRALVKARDERNGRVHRQEFLQEDEDHRRLRNAAANVVGKKYDRSLTSEILVRDHAVQENLDRTVQRSGGHYSFARLRLAEAYDPLVLWSGHILGNVTKYTCEN